MWFSRNVHGLWSLNHIESFLRRYRKHDRSSLSKDHETSIKTLQLRSFSRHSMTFKGILDTGCEAGDLISGEVVSALNLWSEVEFRHEVIGTCLNGSDLRSIGTLMLRVNGRGFRKIFNTRFYVVAGESLSWQVVLGASTCANHHLLQAGAYGSRTVQPKKSKAEEVEAKIRTEEHRKKVAANEAEVKKHKEKIRNSGQRDNSGGA